MFYYFQNNFPRLILIIANANYTGSQRIFQIPDRRKIRTDKQRASKINVMCFRFPSAFCNWINPFAIESMILSRIVVSLIALIITLVALVIIVAMKI